MGAAKAIVKGIKAKFPELYVLGDPLVSVVAFASKSISIADVGAAMAARGWHCKFRSIGATPRELFDV